MTGVIAWPYNSGMIGTAENLARTIVERLQQAGHVAYYAGGCVRDRLMGRVPKDFDVATSARPEEVLQLFPHSQKVGVAFGVVLVRQKRRGELPVQVEVATFRADSTYSDGRHPDAVRFTDAREDARRRDFTCNGLFFDPVSGQLHDFVGGQQDIRDKVLRAIGEPRQRFAEDHLRMLRAVRFAAKLGFEIDPATMQAIRELAPNIRTVSKERVHDEMALILSHTSRARAAALLQSSGLLEQIWPPELFPEPGAPRTFASALPAEADFVVALVDVYVQCAWPPGHSQAVVPRSLSHTGPEVAAFLRRDLMLSNAETEDLAWLWDNRNRLLAWQSMTKAPLKRLIADPRWPRLAMVFRAQCLDPALAPAFDKRIADLKHEGAAPEPFVTGDALIALGATPGRAFKKWLDLLYDRQLEGELRTREEALAAARELVARHSD